MSSSTSFNTILIELSKPCLNYLESNLETAAASTDVVCLYHLFLGRNPEADVLGKSTGRKLSDFALELAVSVELRDDVLHALSLRNLTLHWQLSQDQLDHLDDWLTRRLGCAPFVMAHCDSPIASVDEVFSPELSPAKVLLRAYQDPSLSLWLEQAHGSLFHQALHELYRQYRGGLSQLEGKIEFVNSEFVSGWAQDRTGRRCRLRVEVRHQGRLIATASAQSFRPDLQYRFGGDGVAGFRANWSPSNFRPGLPIDFTLHEASTGMQLGSVYRFANSFSNQLSVAQMLSRELEEIQKRLDALAGMVPQALSYSAFPLEHYDLYRRVHRIPPPHNMASRKHRAKNHNDANANDVRCHFTAVLDVTNASVTAMRFSVDSLRAQVDADESGFALQILIMAKLGETQIAASMLAAADARVKCHTDWTSLHEQVISDHHKSLEANSTGSPWLLLLQADQVMDRESLGWLAQVQASAAPCSLLYWDEDRLLHAGGRAPAREPRHVDPLLRDAFDVEGLLELNGVGTSFGVRRGALCAALEHLSALRASACEASLVQAEGMPTWNGETMGKSDFPEVGQALAIDNREFLLWALRSQGAFVHLGMPLLSRVDDPESAPVDAERRLASLVARARPEALAPLLPDAWQGRAWRRVKDPICPDLPKRLVRWQPVESASKLAVVIPTRDHIQLLKDCVESLRNHALRPEHLDIVVVDNGSVEQESVDYLAAGEASGHLRVLRVDEPFNWSRLNNLAVAATDASQLLFLNNDTLMLTPQWDDILRGLLERPDVGAVGARLLYEDMTIQHAGILFGVEGFAAHEGVGEQPDAPGACFRTQLTRTVRGVTGAFLACTRDTFDRVGPFDDKQLTVAYNDVEWCLRLADRVPTRAIIYAPLLTLIHFESKSRGFDFNDPVKQRRADYERQSLDKLAIDRLLRAVDADSSVHSVWAKPRRSLR